MALRYFGSADAAFEVNYQFDLFAIGQDNQLRTPENNPDGSFTFEGAVENFQARFADFGGDSDPINITNLFAERLGSDTEDDNENELDDERDETSTSSSGDTGPSFNNSFFQNPLTLDLTTELDNDGTDRNRTINYIIDGTVDGTNFNLTLFIEDADENITNGFQLDQNPFMPGFQIFGQTVDVGTATIIEEGEIQAALSDIEFINDNNLLGLITGFDATVGGSDFTFAAEDEDDLINRGGIVIPERGVIIERGQTIIEAEDLNLHVYQTEFWAASNPERPESFEVISLDDAPGDTGTATLDLDQFSITPGTYDLTLSVFDENDGQAQLDVLLDGHLLPNGSIRLDEMGTSNGLPTEDIRREFVIQGIEITSSSEEISIVGTANQEEFARVDFLVFTESDI